MTTTELLTISAIFGLIFGSFFNVTALRIDRLKSVLVGRSACPKCGKTLEWYELIPLLSFLIQGGRCRGCKKPISWRYPIVELCMAGLFTFASWYGWVERGSWVLVTGLLITFSLLFVASLVDLESMELPIPLIIAAALIGCTTRIAADGLVLADALLGLVTGAGFIAVVAYGWKFAFKQQGMGDGDIWLAGVLGLIAGYPLIIPTILSAVMIGAVFGVFLLLAQRLTVRAEMPFGPFLSLGLIFALTYGQLIISWYIL